MAHGIALAGRFDLDDLGPHVAEQLAAERSCDERAEFEHAKVGERAGWQSLVAAVVHGGAVVSSMEVRRVRIRAHEIDRASKSSKSGPRDGLQSESQVLPPPPRSSSSRRLVAAGLRRIEVASFVNPKRVPQMADAEAVLAALAPAGPRARYIGLVLNRKGFERAHAAGCTEVGMAIAASESFSQRNQGCSVDEGVDAWLDIARAARAAGIRAQITISTAFGCPFEGEVPVDRVVRLAERIAAGQPDEIAVADTIGVAVPTQVTRADRRAALGVADTCGCARISTTPATPASPTPMQPSRAGVAVLDASCGGIGGCPFAPAATGNIPTEDLIYMLHRMGVQHRRRPARAARHQPLAAADARSRRTRHGGQGRTVSSSYEPNQGDIDGDQGWRQDARGHIQDDDQGRTAGSHHRSALQGQEGRAVLRARCIHAHLRCQAPAGLRREGR